MVKVLKSINFLRRLEFTKLFLIERNSRVVFKNRMLRTTDFYFAENCKMRLSINDLPKKNGKE